MHPHEVLANTRHGVRNIAALKDLTGRAVALVPDCFHPMRPYVEILLACHAPNAEAFPSCSEVECSTASLRRPASDPALSLHSSMRRRTDGYQTATSLARHPRRCTAQA